MCLLPVCLMSNYLVKIERVPKQALYDLKEMGLIPVDFFENSIIALSDDPGIAYLTTNDLEYQVLDTEPYLNHYYMATSDKDLSSFELSSNIVILDKGDDNWLIKIRDLNDLYELNSHPIELKRVSLSALAQSNTETRSYVLTRDTLIQQMVDAVVYDTIINNVRNLQDFQTRYSTTDSAWACAYWLMDRFTSYGYDSVYFDTFLIEFAPNVVAVKRGMVYPERNYVIGCGHFDCTSEMPTVFAPGADDNASGTAAVIEMARVLSGYLFEYTIYLIAFCGEEQGLLGSEYFAEQAYMNNDTIIGVVNLDMFAYSTPDRDTFTIINDTTYISNLWLANTFSACADTYTTLKKRVWTGRRPYSDHASFNRYGYHAIQGRENVYVSNPYYHTTGDSIGCGYNADTMCFQGIRASLATVATLAIPYEQTSVTEAPAQEQRGQLTVQVAPSILSSGSLVKVSGYLPGSEKAVISFHNVIGQCISEHAIDTPGMGYFALELPCDLPSGVYIVSLRAGAKADQKKIIVCP